LIVNGWDAAVAILREAQRHNLQTAEIRLEDDGEIGFDWGTDASSVISASVSSDGRIGFAALINGWRAFGSDCGRIPDALQEAFRRLAVVPVTR